MAYFAHNCIFCILFCIPCFKLKVFLICRPSCSLDHCYSCCWVFSHQRGAGGDLSFESEPILKHYINFQQACVEEYAVQYYFAYYFAYSAYYFAYCVILFCIFCIFYILQYAEYAEYGPGSIILHIILHIATYICNTICKICKIICKAFNQYAEYFHVHILHILHIYAPPTLLMQTRTYNYM